MNDLASAFSNAEFLPHGYCIAWQPPLLALQVGSDALIALSYYSIPLTLLWFLHRRPDTGHNGVVALFAAFIVACGTVHLMAIYTLWEPSYWAQGWVKAATAAVSLATAVILWPLVPRVAALPSPAALQTANTRLQGEIARREAAQQALQAHQASLEERVQARTADLEEMNRRLEREIAERRQVEAELRSNRQLLQLVFDSIPHNIFVKDTERRFVHVNATYATIRGLPQEGIPGRRTEDFADIPPAVRERMVAADHEVLRENRTVRVPGMEVTLADGRETFWNVTKAPLRDEQGQVTGLVGVEVDITEEVRAQREVQRLNETLEARVAERTAQLEAANRELAGENAERRQAEARFRAVVESAPNAMVLVDREGRITMVNSRLEEWLGYRREELTGEPVEVLVPERFRAAHPGRREGYLADPRPRPMGTGRELYARRKDGSELPVDISLSPLETPEGLRVIAAISDISERKQAAEDLARANRSLETVNRELEAFAYSVSHDLRQPLRAMAGFGEILLEDYAGRLDDEGRGYLGRIIAASQRMGQLIDDLLVLSRITRSELRPEPVDLSALAAEVLHGLRAAEPERAVDVVLAPGLGAEGDPRLLRVLLENLLGNAWKFTGGKADARIEVGRADGAEDDEGAFFVRDNGAGFDMTYADKLFTPFQRLHAASEFAGTGVGLATVQRVVARHGGRVWAEGAEGEGATFYFTLGE